MRTIGDPWRRLRIGYVSPHFRSHAVNFFVEPILDSHDHTAVEVFCFADSMRSDDVTRRLQRHADHWYDIVGQNDEQVAKLVRRQRIDILVDLTGHIHGGCRMLLFGASRRRFR